MKSEPTWESLDQRPVAPWWRDAKFGVYLQWSNGERPNIAYNQQWRFDYDIDLKVTME